MNNIAILLPYKDQFIKDNAGSASIWVKDFSKTIDLSNIEKGVYLIEISNSASTFTEKIVIE